MSINLEKLKKEYKILKELLSDHEKSEPEAKTCLVALQPVFDRIEKGSFTEPYRENPCGYSFVEGKLREYSELEGAYSNFIFTASGSDENELDKFFSSLNRKI